MLHNNSELQYYLQIYENQKGAHHSKFSKYNLMPRKLFNKLVSLVFGDQENLLNVSNKVFLFNF